MSRPPSPLSRGRPQRAPQGRPLRTEWPRWSATPAHQVLRAKSGCLHRLVPGCNAIASTSLFIPSHAITSRSVVPFRSQQNRMRSTPPLGTNGLGPRRRSNSRLSPLAWVLDRHRNTSGKLTGAVGWATGRRGTRGPQVIRRTGTPRTHIYPRWVPVHDAMQVSPTTSVNAELGAVEGCNVGEFPLEVQESVIPEVIACPALLRVLAPLFDAREKPSPVSHSRLGSPSCHRHTNPPSVEWLVSRPSTNRTGGRNGHPAPIRISMVVAVVRTRTPYGLGPASTLGWQTPPA